MDPYNNIVNLLMLDIFKGILVSRHINRNVMEKDFFSSMFDVMLSAQSRVAGADASSRHQSLHVSRHPSTPVPLLSHSQTWSFLTPVCTSFYTFIFTCKLPTPLTHVCPPNIKHCFPHSHLHFQPSTYLLIYKIVDPEPIGLLLHTGIKLVALLCTHKLPHGLFPEPVIAPSCTLICMYTPT